VRPGHLLAERGLPFSHHNDRRGPFSDQLRSVSSVELLTFRLLLLFRKFVEPVLGQPRH
jgi:hypothetical protein